MKLTIILFTCIAAIAFGEEHLQARTLRSRRPMNVQTESDLETPLLGNSLSKPAGARGGVTVMSGPNFPATGFTRTGRSRFMPVQYNDVPVGKVNTYRNSDPVKSFVGGWPYSGGQVTTEMTAKRVKVKMNVGAGLGLIQRKHNDGLWTEEVLSNKGKLTRWYKNEDDSQVTVRARLMGGKHTGHVTSTGKEYDQPDKKRVWS